MIAAVAELRQFAPPPLQIARGDVVEHEHAILEVALGEDLLDAALAAAQEVEGGVEFVLVELEPAHRPERGGDVAVRQRAGDLEALGSQRRQGLAGKHPAQAVDLRLRPVGDVGERARLDLAALAIALAQEDGGPRIAVWDARDVHAKRESYPCGDCNNYFTCLQ